MTINACINLGFVLITGFLTKNFSREFHPIGWFTSVILFLTSILAKSFGFTYSFEASLYGFSQWLFVLAISEIGFLFSLMNIIIIGQRQSLRKGLGLEDKFFDKEKEIWRKKLERFPNLDRILEGLDEGRVVHNLFDQGFFNLTILWSCNVIEEVVDAVVDVIISKDPKKETLFRNERDYRLPYPVQLRNLGYKSYQDKTEFNVGNLWHTRHKIAHRNYRPSYKETNGTLKILISFSKEIPSVLHTWESLRAPF